MKKFRLFILLGFLLALIGACGTSSTPTPADVLPKSRFDPYPEEFRMLGLTNDFRSQARTCGGQQFAAAPALTWVEAVGDTAWFHSSAMNETNSQSHVGDSTMDRLRARGFDPGVTAENLRKTARPAGGQAPNPEDVFNAWKADATACANLMNPNFTVMGAGMFGHYENGIGVFWTQILTTPKGNAPAPTLTASPTTATAQVGGATIALTATLTNSTDAINWNLNGPGNLAPAGATATYTPPATGAGGTATITATAGALTATSTITIAAAPTPTLAVSPATANVTVGGAAIPFAATLTNSNAPISWSLNGGPGNLSTTTGATTNYTPPTTGGATTATLTATAGTVTASATITISAAAIPTISVSPPTATLKVGDAAIAFNATLTNSADTINWSLTGPGSISANTGASTNYTPPPNGAGGTATLTATAGAVTASATITVNAIPTLTVSPTTAIVKVGDGPITFTSSTNQVSWSMTGPGTFSWAGSTFTYFPPASGQGGTATITATSGALTASATVTINPGPPPPPPVATLTISPTTATATIGQPDVQFSANLQGSTDPITWSVAGQGDVYNKTGVFTWYMAPPTGTAGTVTITAKAGNLTASATITLNAAAQSFRDTFLVLINQFRSQPQTCFNGDVVQNMPAVPPVAYNTQLNNAAQAHSEDMANNNFFSHVGLNGSTFGQRATAAGYTGFANGENIAGGDTAQVAFNLWRTSHTGHCQGMMSANANEIGLGYAINGNSSTKHLWTLMTGKQ